MFPSSDIFDDGIGVSGPDEGLGVQLGLGDEAIDGRLQIDDRAEGTAFEPPIGELGKEFLNGVEP